MWYGLKTFDIAQLQLRNIGRDVGQIAIEVARPTASVREKTSQQRRVLFWVPRRLSSTNLVRQYALESWYIEYMLSKPGTLLSRISR